MTLLRAALLSLLATMAPADPVAPAGSAPVPGVTTDSVTFIQIAALEGAAAALGTQMRLGLEAAFAEVNAAGGVHGRQLRLESRDDGYRPDRAATILREVIDGGDHFALIGSVGTPTAAAMQPLVRDARIPMVGAFTGAGLLRKADAGPIVNLRAPYTAETEAWMRYLVDEKGYDKIGILYQDDGFGRVGLAGAIAALEARDLELVAVGAYVRNSRAVKEALLDLRNVGPQAVVIVGAYKPVAEFIRVARSIDFDPEFINISFVGSAALAAELGADAEGVIVSQVVPFPWDAGVPVVERYQAALTAFDEKSAPGFVSLEGYLVGRMAIAGLEAAGRNLTRDRFVAAYGKSGTVDLDGVVLQFAPGDNQGMDDVFLTRMSATGGFERLE